MPVLVENQGARADQAHLALEHIEQLGKLIERPLAERSADSRHARIVRDLEHAWVAAGLGVFVEMRNLTLAFVRIGGHGAELVDAERLVVRSDANLTEEDWPTRVQLDERRQGCEQRAQHDEQGE